MEKIDENNKVKIIIIIIENIVKKRTKTKITIHRERVLIYIQ